MSWNAFAFFERQLRPACGRLACQERLLSIASPPGRGESVSRWERMHSVLTHGAHRQLDVAFGAEIARIPRTEAQAVGVVRVALVGRRRPVVAVSPSVVELATLAAARSGQKHLAAVFLASSGATVAVTSRSHQYSMRPRSARSLHQ